jgi:hypothetical protein
MIVGKLQGSRFPGPLESFQIGSAQCLRDRERGVGDLRLIGPSHEGREEQAAQRGR